MRTIKETIKLIREAEGKEAIWTFLLIGELAAILIAYNYALYF